MSARRELTVRGRERYRHARWSKIGLLAAVLLVEAAVSGARLGATAAGWLLGGTFAFAGLNFIRMRRCRTTVGAAGVTISSGFGRGRTHPWHEIRWVGVHQGSGRFGEYFTLRVTFDSGRTRSLPALQRSSLYPDPDFDANSEEIIAWWKASTDPSTRFRPTGNWLYRKSPEQLGRLLGVVIAVVIVVVVFLIQT
ncbi:PH domain-containing protein [Streptomyces sp. NPDC049040]|uniref:PH domain-containing protein n=1 Tax=Streptomyces sp. NPDC049040 TaxID=3365593 RepID=UPI00371130C3